MKDGMIFDRSKMILEIIGSKNALEIFYAFKYNN